MLKRANKVMALVELIEEFKAAGGKIIVMGKRPEFSEALPSERAKKIAEGAKVIPHSKSEFFSALEEEPIADIRLENGSKCESLITTARRDNDALWLFFAHLSRRLQ